jgi:hypothetical protein
MRISGLVLLGLALVAGAVDVVQAGHLRALGAWWFALHRDSLQLLQPALERHVAIWLWDPVMLTLLQWPLVAVLGVPGLLLAALGRRRA